MQNHRFKSSSTETKCILKPIPYNAQQLKLACRYPLCYNCLLVSFLQNQLFISGDYLGSSIQTYCSSIHRINRMFPGHYIDGSPLLPLFPGWFFIFIFLIFWVSFPDQDLVINILDTWESFFCELPFTEVLNIDDGGAATVRAIIHWLYRTTLQENNFNQYSMNSACCTCNQNTGDKTTH